MATTNVVNTYGDEVRKEDVLGLVEILTAKETSLLNSLGKTKAINTIHSTMTDSLRTTASGAVAEEGDYTNLVRTTPSKLTNLVEIVAIPFRVSRTEQQVEQYHGENEKARQTKKALVEWGNAAEFDLVRSTLTSGVSGTTPKMSGIIEATSKSTNHTSQTSGVAFSASILKGLMKENWNNSNGDVATDLYVGSYLKHIMDDFSNKTNVSYTGSNQKEIIKALDIFESGFGRITVHTHRYVQQSGDATGRVLAIRPDKLKIAYLQRPFIDEGLARSGDYDNCAVVGKMTLEVRNQDSNWFAEGYNIG